MPFLQYPWRWLEAVEAPMAIFFVAAIWPSNRNANSASGSRRSQVFILAACAALFIAATIYAGTTYFQVCYPEDTVASSLVDYRTGAGFEGMYEYEPPDGDLSIVPTGMPDACLVSDPYIVLGKPDPDDPSTIPHGLRIKTPARPRSPGPPALAESRTPPVFSPPSLTPAILVLHLMRYPAWTVRLNGQLFTSLPHRDDGLIAVPVPSGPINLTIDWTTISRRSRRPLAQRPQHLSSLRSFAL